MFGTKTKQVGHDDGEIPIVQGFESDGDAPLLSNDYAGEVQQNYILDTSGTTPGSYYNGRKGEVQPEKYNDLPFAVAFLAQLGIVGYNFFLAISNHETEDNVSPEISPDGASPFGFVVFLFANLVCAVALSSLAMTFMVNHSRNMIKASIFFVLGIHAIIFMFGVVFTSGGVGLAGLISAAYVMYWAYTAWSRIPFAAANLHTAICAVRAYQKGLGTVAFFHFFLSQSWIFFWGVAFGETFVNTDSSMIRILTILSYYWTRRVIEVSNHISKRKRKTFRYYYYFYSTWKS